MDCIFCKIISGEIPAKILTETKNSVAFMDAFPLTKGHSLVIPKKHYEKVQDIPLDENTDLFSTVQKVLSKVDTVTGSTLVAIHNGKESGQEIPHVHVHLIPRTESDGAGAVHSMFKDLPTYTTEEKFELYDKLKQ